MQISEDEFQGSHPRKIQRLVTSGGHIQESHPDKIQSLPRGPPYALLAARPHPHDDDPTGRKPGCPAKLRAPYPHTMLGGVDSPPTAPGDVPGLQGWMEKKGKGKLGTFKNRFFRVEQSKLVYYESREAREQARERALSQKVCGNPGCEHANALRPQIERFCQQCDDHSEQAAASARKGEIDLQTSLVAGNTFLKRVCGFSHEHCCDASRSFRRRLGAGANDC